MKPDKVTSEFARFDDLLSAVLKVPHSEIKAKLDAEKEAKAEKKRKPKTSASGHASTDKG